ncbi:MAG: aldo/keto reductase [bacterium]
MQTKQLGNTDLHLTRIGLGTWAMGSGGWAYSWGDQNDQASIATIQRALELGINWIDTAPVYGLGHAEEIVGKAIKTLAEKPIIATKCSLVWDEHKNISSNLKKASIKKEVEDSLKRLQIDVIDLYQIHWPNPPQDIEEGWGAVAELVLEGKIRYAGVSNFSVKQLKRIQPIHPVASLQPPYSLLERGIEKELLTYCAQNHIGVIVYSPMQMGVLTDKFTREWVESLPEGDHRHRENRQFQEPQLSANLALVESLRVLARQRGVKVAQLAIAWTLRRPEITAAIVGARRPAQIEESVKAAELQLSESDLTEIEALLENHYKVRT